MANYASLPRQGGCLGHPHRYATINLSLTMFAIIVAYSIFYAQGKGYASFCLQTEGKAHYYVSNYKFAFGNEFAEGMPKANL